jgi:hypothetical protein
LPINRTKKKPHDSLSPLASASLAIRVKGFWYRVFEKCDNVAFIIWVKGGQLFGFLFASLHGMKHFTP